MYQSFHRYKVYKMKSAHFTKTANCYRIAKTCKNVYICTFSIPKNMSGCCKLLKTFPSWPKDSKTNHLNLSELVCLNSEHDWTNPKDNSVKILWPIQTQQGNQYRQNYVTVTYVLWEQMNRHTVDLGFIQSRAEVTAVFENVDTWIMVVFINGLGIKRKIEKIGKEQLKTHAKTNGPHRQKESESSKKHEQELSSHACARARARACAYACARACACACVCRCFRKNCSTTSGAFKSSPLSSQCRTVGRRRVLQDLYSRNFVCLCSGRSPDHGIWELVHPLSFVPTTPPQFRTLKWWRHRRS